VCVNPLSSPQQRPEKAAGRSADFAQRIERGAFRRFARRLDAERTRVEARGTPVLLIQPSAADLEVIPMNWMATRPRRAVARRAVDTTVDALCAPDAQQVADLLRSAVA